MITLEIDNEKIERFYYDEFGGDKEKFIKFIAQNCVANNADEDLSQYQDEIDEAMASGDSGYTHEEIFERLRRQYLGN